MNFASSFESWGQDMDTTVQSSRSDCAHQQAAVLASLNLVGPNARHNETIGEARPLMSLSPLISSSSHDLDNVRDVVELLYHKQNRKLSQVMKIIRDKHGITASYVARVFKVLLQQARTNSNEASICTRRNFDSGKSGKKGRIRVSLTSRAIGV